MLTKALQEKHNAFLVVLDELPQHEKHLRYIQAEGLRHTILRGSFLKKLQQFRRFLRENQIEVIFTYLPSDTVFGALAGRLEKIPYVLGGIRNAELGGIKRTVLRWVHKHWLQYSISNSHVGMENFIDYGFVPEKLLVMPNGLELELEPTHRTEAKTPLKIISVGRYVEQKDYETALKAFQLLRRNFQPNRSIILQLVGFGPLEEQIRQWVVDYGMENDVELIISPPNLGDYYLGADIYLCTSLVEGLSNSVMEAMSYSLPVVATDAGDNCQLVKADRNGYITKVGDAEAIAEALHALVKAPEKRQRYGEASFQVIKDNYTFEAFQQNYFGLIEKLPVL